MSEGRLLIGTKRYSSWSLRGWLAVRLAGLEVEETVIPLTGGRTEAVKAATPAGFVPFLEHRGARVWESLAIVEYCAEVEPRLWPQDRVRRAALRSAATEMHGGFAGLRQAYPTIMGARAGAGARDALANPEALAALNRVAALWEELLWHSGGPFLHGASMGAADAMYAPVASRILTWALEVPPAARRYVEAVHAHPLMERWHEEAAAEPESWRLAPFEALLRPPTAAAGA